MSKRKQIHLKHYKSSKLFLYILVCDPVLKIQSTLVISNSKGLSEILRDIRTSTYQNCNIEEKTNRATTFNKCICNWTLEGGGGGGGE